MTTHPIPDDSVVSRRTDLPTQELDGDLVMADVQAGQFYGLGGSARRIWELLKTPSTLSALCKTLTAEYDVPMDECRADVQEFLGQLVKAGLITVG